MISYMLPPMPWSLPAITNLTPLQLDGDGGGRVVTGETMTEEEEERGQDASEWPPLVHLLLFPCINVFACLNERTTVGKTAIFFL